MHSHQTFIQLHKQRSKHVPTTLYQYVKTWYETYKKPKHALTTIQVQSNYINTHIKNSVLGKMTITNVRTEDIQKFINDLLASGNKCKLKNNKNSGNGLAKSTVKKIRGILISAMKQAVKDNIIVKNYADDTETINLDKQQYSFFSKEAIKLFLSKTKKHRYSLAYRLLFYTGCRRSEILGLSWDNIDFENKQLTIKQVLVIPENIPIIKKTPKTNSSYRTIPLHKDLLRDLKEYKKQHLSNNLYNLVFTDKSGNPYNPKNFSQNFKKQIKRLGLSSTLHVHSTRHTFATNLLQLKIPISDVQSLGGWSSSDVLLDIYAHAVKSTHRQAINKLYETSK